MNITQNLENWNGLVTYWGCDMFTETCWHQMTQGISSWTCCTYLTNTLYKVFHLKLESPCLLPVQQEVLVSCYHFRWIEQLRKLLPKNVQVSILVTIWNSLTDDLWKNPVLVFILSFAILGLGKCCLACDLYLRKYIDHFYIQY